MTEGVIIVIGAGPGVSGSVARRYAREGFDIGIVGIAEAELRALERELSAKKADVQKACVDVTDTHAASEAIRAIGEHFGRVDVLHFNPSAFREKDPLELAVPELLADMALGVGALLTAVQAARPFMSDGARITVTGSMAADKPWHRAASLGVQKAGVRNLVRSIDASLAPVGVRAVSVTVNGALAPDGPFSPDLIAEALWSAARQDVSCWQPEIVYSGSSQQLEEPACSTAS